MLAVLTAAEARADRLKPLLPYVAANTQTGEPFAFTPQPLLAAGKVRYVGEPVALDRVAETSGAGVRRRRTGRYRACAVAGGDDRRRGLRAGRAASVARGLGAICASNGVTGEGTAGGAARRRLHVVTLSLENHRIGSNPIEPRGGVGLYDPATGRYTLHVSGQSIHATRDRAAPALGVESARVRLIAPDVGGGFGAKNFIYPEHVLLPWAAERVGWPVKWIASRKEALLADHCGRDQVAEATLALDAEGWFLALRGRQHRQCRRLSSRGSAGGVQTFQYVSSPGTACRILWAIELRIAGVFTNTAPIGVLRGPGHSEANNIIERLIDAAAAQTGLDRAELRRRKSGPGRGHAGDQRRRQHQPSRTAAPSPRPSSVASPSPMSRVRSAGGRARPARPAARARLRLPHYSRGRAGRPPSIVEIRFAADGDVSLLTGTPSIGQGHETTFLQILADRLGLAL